MEEPVHRNILRSVGYPDIVDARAAEFTADKEADFATASHMLDPELTDFVIPA